MDPIGLAGGLNTYSYMGDPLVWVDPLGLICKSAYSGRRGTVKAKAALEKRF
nr:hypothetical protein [Cronobacter malonaticus]